MKFLNLTFLFLVVVCAISAQTTTIRNSALDQAVGGASVTSIETISSLENISSLSLNKSLSVGITSQNNFLLKELTVSSLGIVYSNKKNGYGLQFTRSGNNFYNESKLGLAYAKPLSEKIYLGVRVNLLRIQQQFYGNKSLLDVELGLRAVLTDKVTFSTHIYNPFSFRTEAINKEEVAPNSGLRTGFSYHDKKLTLNLEVESSRHHSFLIKSGMIWHLNSFINLRAGTSFPGNHLSGGMGVSIKKCTLQFFYKYHLLLNSSAGIGVNYGF